MNSNTPSDDGSVDFGALDGSPVGTKPQLLEAAVDGINFNAVDTGPDGTAVTEQESQLDSDVFHRTLLLLVRANDKDPEQLAAVLRTLCERNGGEEYVVALRALPFLLEFGRAVRSGDDKAVYVASCEFIEALARPDYQLLKTLIDIDVFAVRKGTGRKLRGVLMKKPYGDA